MNLKRRHRDYLIRFQEMPDVSPYHPPPLPADALSLEAAEKRACSVVREVLGMAVEKRTLVDHLTHFRSEFGLPNRLRGMLVRHPEMFYVSIKGQRDSVFLVEAYDDKGKLLVEDELVEARERLVELVREGKRMRRAARRGVDGGDEDDDIDEEGEEEDVDDGFGDLFDSGIGDDWEEFDIPAEASDDDGVEDGELWSKKGSVDEWSGGRVGLEVW